MAEMSRGANHFEGGFQEQHLYFTMRFGSSIIISGRFLQIDGLLCHLLRLVLSRQFNGSCQSIPATRDKTRQKRDFDKSCFLEQFQSRRHPRQDPHERPRSACQGGDSTRPGSAGGKHCRSNRDASRCPDPGESMREVIFADGNLTIPDLLQSSTDHRHPRKGSMEVYLELLKE